MKPIKILKNTKSSNPFLRWYGAVKFVPNDYKEGEILPVIVFFPGIGGGGDGSSTGLNKVLSQGMAAELAKGRELPKRCIVFCPQSSDGWWTEHSIKTAIDYILKTCKVSQIECVTGLSAGCQASLMVAYNYGVNVIKSVLVCAMRSFIGSDPTKVKNLPVWILNNRGDMPGDTDKLINALTLAGADLKTTIWDTWTGDAHNSWDKTYSRDDVYEFMTQSISEIPNVPPVVIEEPKPEIPEVPVDNTPKIHKILKNQEIVDNEFLLARPGDTIVIEGGLRSNLIFKNFIGTPTNRIKIKNEGLVTIKSETKGGLVFHNCSDFQILGNGDSNYKYGIKISAALSGVSFSNFTTDFEAGYIEVVDNKGVGVVAKTDPKFADPKTWRANFVMRNLDFHNIYVHDSGSHNAGGEAFYIGHTSYPGWEDLQGNKLYPHIIENLKIHDCIVEDIAWDGIQVSSCAGGALVYNNIVKNVGLLNNGGQSAGILMGAGTVGIVYNNTIDGTTGNGLQLFGMGGLTAHHNLIKNTGKENIFIDDRATDPTLGFYVHNNTLINAGDGYYSMKSFAAKALITDVRNNIIVRNNTRYMYFEDLSRTEDYKWKVVKYIDEGNVTETNMSNIDFIDWIDYKLPFDSIHKGKGYFTEEEVIPEDPIPQEPTLKEQMLIKYKELGELINKLE